MALDGIPSVAGQSREDWIYQAVCAGQAQYTMGTVSSTYNGHTAEFTVFTDALKIDGVRINCNAQTEQKIADTIGCILLTPKLADLIWLQRQVTLPPFPRGNTVGMDTTQAMIDHSSKIDAALVAQGNPTGLVSTVGKHWVIDNDILLHQVPFQAENYGWHFLGTIPGVPAELAVTKDASGHGVQVIQGRGWRHDMHEADYSQTCVLAGRWCLVGGQSRDLLDVLKDPDLAPLASHQGVLKIFRQPGVTVAVPPAPVV